MLNIDIKMVLPSPLLMPSRFTSRRLLYRGTSPCDIVNRIHAFIARYYPDSHLQSPGREHQLWWTGHIDGYQQITPTSCKRLFNVIHAAPDSKSRTELINTVCRMRGETMTMITGRTYGDDHSDPLTAELQALEMEMLQSFYQRIFTKG